MGEGEAADSVCGKQTNAVSSSLLRYKHIWARRGFELYSSMSRDPMWYIQGEGEMQALYVRKNGNIR